MKAQLLILDADYIEQETAEGPRPVVRLFCKTKDGKTAVVLDKTFEPYFYILPREGKIKDVQKRIAVAMEKQEEMQVKKIEVVERALAGEKKKFLKIVCDLPVNVPKIRDLVKAWEDRRGVVEEEYEYALSFYKRYLIDKGLAGMGWVEVEGEKIAKDGYTKIDTDVYQADIVITAKKVKPLELDKISKLKILAFDIECVEEAGKNKVIMISLAAERFKKVLTYQEDHYPAYVEVVADEKALLKRFVELIAEKDPDIIVGFNTDEFDFQVLRERAESYPDVALKLSRDGSRMLFARRARITTARLKGRAHIDLFVFINNILAPQLQTEVLTLDAVSAELLGDKKIEMEFEEILEAWRKKKDLAKLAEYCLKDSELTLRLADLLLPQIFETSRIVGQLPFDVSRMTYGQLVEWYLSKRAFEKKETIPNQPKWEEVQRRRAMRPYVGAFVKEPIAGIHEGIAVVDFRSLYPSIIATFNISPETFDCECCAKTGWKVPELKHWFCKKHKGFVASVIRELIEKRAELKKKMAKLRISKDTEEQRLYHNRQFALKTISNACYGMLAFAGAKWYCRECAESTAAFGRSYIKQVMERAQKEGFVVIYGDSDSVFLKMAAKGNLSKKTAEFIKKINRWLPGIMELDLQGFYVRGIFIPRGVGPGTAKKRYALIDEKGKLTIRGLERVRRDWSEVAKRTQERVLRYVLEKKDVRGAVRYVRGIIENLRQQKIPLRDLTIYEQLTKPLSEYRAIGPHVVAARKIKERGKPFGVGMVVMFVITKGRKGESISQRAEPVEDVSLKDIDIDYYTGHQIIPAALRILAVLGVTEDELLGKAKQHGLEKFVKK